MLYKINKSELLYKESFMICEMYRDTLFSIILHSFKLKRGPSCVVFGGGVGDMVGREKGTISKFIVLT